MWSDLVRRVTETSMIRGHLLMIPSVPITLRMAGAEASRLSRQTSQDDCGSPLWIQNESLGPNHDLLNCRAQVTSSILFFLWSPVHLLVGWGGGGSPMNSCQSRSWLTVGICFQFLLSLLPLLPLQSPCFSFSELLASETSGLLTVTLLQLLYVGATWFLLPRLCFLFINT